MHRLKSKHPRAIRWFHWINVPLLAMPVKDGYKSLKRIGSIQFTDNRPDDFWAKYGYDWYAGL
ncbi:MAG: hypothetical protein HY290_17835 [Planctomycetia bacterium]|nr:hypothetical protein [Planctomycetia bacterium]